MKRAMSLAGICATLLLLPQWAAAQLPIVYCGDLPGCPAGGFTKVYQQHVSGLLNLLYNQLSAWGYALGGLFIIIGGVHMLTSAGNDERVTKGRQTIIWALAGIFVANFATHLIYFTALAISPVSGIGVSQIIPVKPTFTNDLISNIIVLAKATIFDLLYTALFGIGLYSGIMMVVSREKEEDFKKAAHALLYAAIGAIVINFAEAIINAWVNI